ncbi:carbohydrate kinase [Virgibacillus dakarensis]|uniref:Fructosamine kinase FrlD n=1 Tax=Lentibacillus populi TaxID=1827502 RepID=A0A9W5U0U0_9BACI|nr:MULTISPECIES: PfkB family carbohydrate kinase [Bacillaceae]MBT2215494.1 carbohydrate kinase [Virgibacillus dakarensis]MTW86217.1 carbohydrate kinase [Virgibacillus dakarensis]GGB54709.1 fructosamine kinase FrlD [Lentibacillus populi]
MNIITIGDNVVDCYLDRDEYFPGGNAVNVAVNCKRSGAEKVGYIGVFATDDKADHLKYALGLEGVNYNLSRVVKGVSGQPKVNLTNDGDRVFVSSPQNTVQHKVKLRLVEEDYEYIDQFDICHTSCYSFLEEELPKLSRHIKVSFDFSENYNWEYLEKVCPHISIGFFSGASLTDAEIESLIKKLSEYDLETIGITRGSKPAIFIHNGNRYLQEVDNVEVIDTMGAGDSFIGGFLTDYFTNKDIKKALQFAAKRSGVTCGFYGGFGYPKEMK